MGKWNRAAIFKQVRAVANKEDILWPRWINHVYLKDGDIWEHCAPQQSSWYCRKLMEIKDEFKDKYISKVGEKYLIREGYKMQVGYLEKKHWHRQVWNRMNVPKHSFILWLVVQNRMSTRGILVRHNLVQDDVCVLCGTGVESVKHLFFTCLYAKLCL